MGAVVGFSGARDLGGAWAALVRRVMASCAAGCSLLVGCAPGADRAVIGAALAAGLGGSLSVFAVGGPSAGFPGGAGPAPAWVLAAASAGASVRWWAGGPACVPLRARLAARSAALVSAVAASGGSLVVFAGGPCPAGVVPSRAWPGGGSGSWASAALAAGLAVPLSVFWCAAGPAVLPAWPGGSWSPAPSGAWAWAPAPAPVQPALF